jgi:hypothetical protein
MDRPSLCALAALARRIDTSQLAAGLFAWTSLFDLCIVQGPVSYPYNRPFLRLSPVSGDQIEFRYVDTWNEAKQWSRKVDCAQVGSRLLNFLDQLRWFPKEVLESEVAGWSPLD